MKATPNYVVQIMWYMDKSHGPLVAFKCYVLSLCPFTHDPTVNLFVNLLVCLSTNVPTLSVSVSLMCIIVLEGPISEFGLSLPQLMVGYCKVVVIMAQDSPIHHTCSGSLWQHESTKSPAICRPNELRFSHYESSNVNQPFCSTQQLQQHWIPCWYIKQIFTNPPRLRF